MTENEGTSQDVDEYRNPPHKIRMPGFIHEEIGLGDAIQRVTYAIGIKPCGGCKGRGEALNRWLVFSR